METGETKGTCPAVLVPKSCWSPRPLMELMLVSAYQAQEFVIVTSLGIASNFPQIGIF
jgi:hypothetical protein